MAGGAPITGAIIGGVERQPRPPKVRGVCSVAFLVPESQRYDDEEAGYANVGTRKLARSHQKSADDMQKMNVATHARCENTPQHQGSWDI